MEPYDPDQEGGVLAADKLAGESDVRLKIGTCEITNGIREVSRTSIRSSDPTHHIEIDRAQMLTGAPEYRSRVEIWKTPDPGVGWVTTASVAGDSAILEVRTAVMLSEKRTSIVTREVPPRELAWGIARAAGLPENQLDIAGLVKRSEDFVVTMPVRGLADDVPGLRIGPVTLDRNRTRVIQALDFVYDQRASDADGFVEAGAWAWVVVSASTLFDADQRGVELIETALDRLTLAAQYSLAYAPDGSMPEFDRNSLFADPRADRTVLARGHTTARSWLRHLTEREQRSLGADPRIRIGGPPVGEDRRFDEAVKAWRRAVQTTDTIAAVTALWEALEFYTAEVTLDPILAPKDRKAIVTAIGGLSLSDAQQARLTEVLGRANEPSLMMKLLDALATDRVPYASEEVATLGRVRKARNDFVHGRSRTEPDPNDLDLGKGFVNRILVYWARSPRRAA